MRLPIAAAIFLSLATPAAAQSQAEFYRQAFRKADAGDIAGARANVAGTPDKLLDKMLTWIELSRWRGGSFEAASTFLTQNPDWPGQNALKLRAEEWLALNPSHATVLAWFDKTPPTSRDGRIRLANAYRATGREADGVGLLRRVWVEDNFGPGDEKNFLANYGALIEPKDDWARLDRVLWRNQTDVAKRQMMRVDLGHRALADARLHLTGALNGAEGALAKVPQSLHQDPGLIYARLKWYRIKNRDAEARAILLKPPANLVRPDLWWVEREIEIRRALGDGDNATAYKLARDHRLTDGNDFHEAEWLAGWSAMRQRDPKAALGHFRNLFLNARHPVVQARSAYWAGRALEDLNQPKEARESYAKAAAHLTTFYGQLAAGKLGGISPAQLPLEPKPAAADKTAFDAREVPRVVRRLIAIGEQQRVDPFVMRLVEVSEKPEQLALTGALARDTGRIDLASTVARRAFRDGVVLLDAGYPLLPQVPRDPAAGPEAALVHALIRQESNFAIEAVSRAGARGLMQLMPSTAKWMAGKMGVPYNEPLLTVDPKYNISIGNAYLTGVLDGFAGSYVLSLAGYNAGPGRVRQWMREFGDPREPGRDIVDWIELIPFNETRGYVQRVLEGLQVYRLRMTPAAVTSVIPASAAPAKPILPSASAGWCMIACLPQETPPALPAGTAPAQAPALAPTPIGLTPAIEPAPEVGGQPAPTPATEPTAQPVFPPSPPVSSRDG